MGSKTGNPGLVYMRNVKATMDRYIREKVKEQSLDKSEGCEKNNGILSMEGAEGAQ